MGLDTAKQTTGIWFVSSVGFPLHFGLARVGSCTTVPEEGDSILPDLVFMKIFDLAVAIGLIFGPIPIPVCAALHVA